jgi:adenine specific DNA methylase Mod
MGEQQRMDFGRLYFGDNLKVLPRHIDSESVDLIYLDPPFNSGKNYNLLFEHKDGEKVAAQIKAFEDTWEWNEISSREYEDVVREGGELSNTIRAFRQLLGGCDMLAYLTMMAPRLVQLKRVLKPGGSIYLHCDPNASHYLKLLMDAIFEPENFRNEIVWKRTSGHSDAKRFGRAHDVILFYGNSTDVMWNEVYQPYDESYVEQYYRYKDPDGRRFMSGDASAAGLSGGGYEYEWHGVTRVWRYPIETMTRLHSENRIFYTRNGIARTKRYLDESKGMPAQDVWTDLEAVRSWHKERLPYPTQKPLSLLERIIEASSKPGEVVLDPFCGCGTAVDAAQKLGRRWIGIDITEMAIEIIRDRLATQYGAVDYYMGGEPGTSDEAEALARLDKYEFQRWACEFIGAKNRPKKGADRGIDGTIDGTYEDGSPWRAIVSVKGGSTGRPHVAELRGTVERDKDRDGADIGIFVTLRKPTPAMKLEATEAGFTDTGHARLQILTVADLFAGKRPDLPERADKPSSGRKLKSVS